MASSSKRQCTFTDILRERYPLMKQGRESTEVYCTVCDCYISIKYKGAFDIDTHIKSNKHKNQLLTVSKTRKIDTIFQSASSQSKTKESAAEATLAFHTVKHHQSYNSMDCTGRLMKSQIAKIERENNSVMDIVQILNLTRETLKARAGATFVPLKVRELMSNWTQDAKETFIKDVKDAYNTCIDYLDKWLQPLDEFKIFDWMMILKNVDVDYEKVVSSMQFINGYGTSSTSNDQVLTTVNLNKDPVLWEINDTLREIIAKSGFDQNKSCDLSKSEKIYADQHRFLSVGIFQRKMKNNEVKDRNWLVYSESKRSVYCRPSLAFGPLEYTTQFENEGFNDWKNAGHRVAPHENSARP
ncbi:hypothetical protein EVAR_43281_1 [Eumeta japonica]|uniref:Uncharacterized protein n=1 Tax=Eumeta variegata TaxID=151549 RepID=A0A4C1X079_EUMVA|nr:hypothetical protein EVAR_43281_1 [Eumeta japonica]